MSKKRAVPTALHSELSDYASLLRVLRTGNTLDVASQLRKSLLVHGEDDRYEADPSVSGDSRPESPVSKHPSGPLPVDTDPEAVHRKLPVKQGTRIIRDVWTRWPLPPDEVQPTEWGFREEIKSLAQQTLKFHFLEENEGLSGSKPVLSSGPGQHHHEGTDSFLPDIESLPSPALRFLTEASSVHLERMLASIVSLAPTGESSFEPRFNGLGWEAVLQAVSTAGLFDLSSVEFYLVF